MYTAKNIRNNAHTLSLMIRFIYPIARQKAETTGAEFCANAGVHISIS